MKRIVLNLLILVIFCLTFSINYTPASAATVAEIPTFSILSVAVDTSVTVLTYNFPASHGFDVLMGYMGTRGVNGIKVATLNSGAGGSFIATFNIPPELRGQYQIAIRLQSNQGAAYHAYNWFYNQPGGIVTNYPPEYGDGGIPTFSIAGVVRDVSVTIITHKFPANDSFDVLMNYMGTRGINGFKVATVSSGAGGKMTFTFPIPDHLKGEYQIAIRLQSNTGSGFAAYNWFYNNTGGSSGTGGVQGYYGYPTFSIASVIRNQSVTIMIYNLPPGDKFDVFMGPMGSQGQGGYYVSSFDAGAGGSQTLTFNIPNQLYGSYQIALRIQSNTGTGLYAYNWFYN
ncbi:MAG: hypothetical protein A2Z16_09490 [Chloroflexi bacterium RBG_16_54_18]|nr:MAG: hypothetical protein A2Z16_09490 [Chloroflexi bacterium RBG_16_54_18]